MARSSYSHTDCTDSVQACCMCASLVAEMRLVAMENYWMGSWEEQSILSRCIAPMMSETDRETSRGNIASLLAAGEGGGAAATAAAALYIVLTKQHPVARVGRQAGGLLLQGVAVA